MSAFLRRAYDDHRGHGRQRKSKLTCHFNIARTCCQIGIGADGCAFCERSREFSVMMQRRSAACTYYTRLESAHGHLPNVYVSLLTSRTRFVIVFFFFLFIIVNIGHCLVLRLAHCI